MTSPGRRVFVVTGATGFLGKVLLETLVRRADELSIGEIGVVIRPRAGRSAHERFARSVSTSRCFAHLPRSWTARVRVLAGDVESPQFALGEHDAAFVRSATHLVHAAASVDFDLPAAQAARANVGSALHALELARQCAALERFVYVSTAFAAPHRADGRPIPESPLTLAEPAARLYAECLASRDDAALLRRAGYANSYMLTKALAEVLLAEHAAGVPCSIVRPSIITASRVHPLRGWIDSPAAFAAIALAMGLGQMRALVCDPESRVDLVPVDDVAARIVHAAVHDRGPLGIRHAVAGIAHSPTVQEARDGIVGFFRMHRVDRPAWAPILGVRNARFAVADLALHRLPILAARTRSVKAARRAQKRAARVAYLNQAYAYFTTHTFDFESSLPIDGDFDGKAFVGVTCQGVYRHILRRDDREWIMAGREHPGFGGDLRWALGQAEGNRWIRAGVWAVAKVLRRAAARVTVDVPSFERARAALPPGAALVLTPSHRSYLDFVLCNYLAAARPDLVPLPHFAATTDFAAIPLLGRLFLEMNAFYVRRGDGRIDPNVSRHVTDLIERGEMPAFFIEGARSRTGRFLPPKRGLLRCVQDTGRTCLLLPVSISYDRVPERAAFARELAGEPKSGVRLTALLRWTAAAWLGRVDLGHVHIACGDPVLLEPSSDLRVMGRTVIERLADCMRPPRSADLEPAGVAASGSWTPAPAAMLLGNNAPQ